MGFFSSLGSILKPVTSVVGGILGLDSQKKANAANQAFADSQFNFQKDYIQNQIQWKVEDAKKAGVHPMAALGIQSPGFSPVSSTQQPLDYSWVGDLGQSANYAATKAKTTPQQQQMIDLQIRGLELDNEYKQAQIDQMKVDTLASSIASNQAFNSPSAPSLTGKDTLIEGQNDSPVKDLSILGKGAHKLFNIAMHGNSAVLVLNPDIADSISESMVNNTIASIVREVETGDNHELIDEIISHFPKHIRKAIDDGKMRLASIPGSGSFRVVPVGPDESFERYNVFGIN